MLKSAVSAFPELVALASSSPAAFVLSVLLAVLLIVWLVSRAIEWAAKAFIGICAELERHRTRSANRLARQSFLNRREQFLKALETDLAGIARAEAWNDQHFTDLEVEVEVEGTYFASALQQLLGQVATGLRRSPSLMRAVDQSTEKCLLLTGEPGSGKSVALRHLALQLTERGRKSKDERHKVPLYINLRELDVPRDQEVNSELIRNFVIENVRRGDVDAADYVKLNWADFKEKGIWFFLFDSFDEIPAILHAAHSDSAVSQYSEAIRQFMDGVHGCRGVLASREYKSPRSIGWPKLKILPMSESSQERLISRSFLLADLKPIALKTISASRTATYQNPLFLTLLCRFVKEKAVAPVNEHELLYAHVESLARRDRDYVVKKWAKEPEDILRSAAQLAKLFAMDHDLGLAPTRHAIGNAVMASDDIDLGMNIHELLDLLTYLKIGRTDVPTTSEAKRRFAFAHRRYQECLYASYLAENLDRLPLERLVLDARWREYVVALLQVGKVEAALRILDRVKAHLEASDPLSKSRVRKYYGQHLLTIEWQEDVLRHVLSIFQEAVRYREFIDLEKFSEPVQRLADNLWSKGDYFDRVQVLQTCSAGFSVQLSTRVERAIESGVERLEEAALHACKFVTEPSEGLAAWMRRCVAQRIFASGRRFESLRWEALASELPPAYRMELCVARASQLYRSRRFFGRSLDFVGLIEFLIFHGSRSRGKADQSPSNGLSGNKAATLFAILYCYAFVACMAAVATILTKPMSPLMWGLLVVASIAGGVLLRDLTRIVCLDFAVRITPGLLFRRIRNVYNKYRRQFGRGAIMLLVWALPGAVVYLFHSMLGWLPSVTFELLFTGSTVLWGLALVLGLTFVDVADKKVRRTAVQRFEGAKSLGRAIASAESGKEVFEIVQTSLAQEVSKEDARDAIALISAVERARGGSKGTSNLPAWAYDRMAWPLRAVSDLIERVERDEAVA